MAFQSERSPLLKSNAAVEVKFGGGGGGAFAAGFSANVDRAIGWLDRNPFAPIFSWNDSARLSITPSKGYFVGGERCTGTITIQVLQPTLARSLKLRAYGYERVETNTIDTVTEGEEQVNVWRRSRHRNQFFDMTLDVARFAGGGLRPGVMEVPFSFQLPDNLPGSFYEREPFTDRHPHIHREEIGRDDDMWYEGEEERGFYRRGRESRPRYHAEVMVKLMATLEVNGWLSSNFHCTVPLSVHAKLERPMQVAHAHKKGQVMFCCCIPRGEVTVQAAFNKNSYTEGETALVEAKVDNESAQTVKLVAKLMRVLKIRGRNGMETFTDVVVRQDYGKIEPGTMNAVTQMQLALTHRKICPTVLSRLVECYFRFEIEGQVAMAFDIEAHLPVQIYAPPPPPVQLPPAAGLAVLQPPPGVQVVVPQPQQGYPPQQAPQQGYPPQQAPQQGYPPQQQQQGYPPQQQAPQQGYPPQQQPQQGYPPQQQQPQNHLQQQQQQYQQQQQQQQQQYQQQQQQQQQQYQQQAAKAPPAFDANAAQAPPAEAQAPPAQADGSAPPAAEE